MQTQTAWQRPDADCWKPLLLKWWVGYSLPILLPPPLKAFLTIYVKILTKIDIYQIQPAAAVFLLFHLSIEYVCPGTSIIAILPEPTIPTRCPQAAHSAHPIHHGPSLIHVLDLIKWIVHLHLWQSSVQPKSSLLYMSVTNTVQWCSVVMSVCDNKLIRA